jgi:cytochrome c5
MGAPKITDKGAWQSRIKQGKQTLYQHAINGLGAMPPKGGQASLSNQDVQAAVDYMVAQVSGSDGGGKQAASTAGGESGGGMPSADQLVTAPGSGLVIMNSPEQIKNPYAGDKKAIAQGEQLFLSMNCVGCHAPEAGGGMGPPLTDVASVYGDQPADIYLTISNGRPNGMPAYGNALPQDSIWKLAAYVKTLPK